MKAKEVRLIINAAINRYTVLIVALNRQIYRVIHDENATCINSAAFPRVSGVNQNVARADFEASKHFILSDELESKRKLATQMPLT